MRRGDDVVKTHRLIPRHMSRVVPEDIILRDMMRAIARAFENRLLDAVRGAL